MRVDVERQRETRGNGSVDLGLEHQLRHNDPLSTKAHRMSRTPYRRRDGSDERIAASSKGVRGTRSSGRSAASGPGTGPSASKRTWASEMSGVRIVFSAR